MKDVDVRFGSGRDVLNAYWGFLSDGGLIIQNDHGLDEGQMVAVRVHIESSGTTYAFAGRVVRCSPGSGEVVIAFNPGEPHDLLLTAAIAETDNVPARRHRRFSIAVDARVTNGEGPVASIRLLNLSESGCCLRLPENQNGHFPLGSKVEVATSEFSASGVVVWAHNAERGVRFTAEPSEALGAVRRYLARL